MFLFSVLAARRSVVGISGTPSRFEGWVSVTVSAGPGVLGRVGAAEVTCDELGAPMS